MPWTRPSSTQAKDFAQSTAKILQNLLQTGSSLGLDMVVERSQFLLHMIKQRPVVIIMKKDH